MEGTTTTISDHTVEKRIALVTGSNRGIGLEICRQLAANGLTVILTARDEHKGIQAMEELNKSGLCDVIFHQLDITQSSSIDSLAQYIKTQFGKLDILVNNAAVGGAKVDPVVLQALKQSYEQNPGEDILQSLILSAQQTIELAEECLKTNYHGTKNITKALIPLLEASSSARIINMSSDIVQTKNLSNEILKEAVSNVDDLSEDKLNKISTLFLEDFKHDLLSANNWPTIMSAYIVSKVLVNAFTRLLVRQHPTLCITCVDPGFVKTDMNYHMGALSVDEGAKGPVTVALMPKTSCSGLFFNGTQVGEF